MKLLPIHIINRLSLLFFLLLGCSFGFEIPKEDGYVNLNTKTQILYDKNEVLNIHNILSNTFETPKSMAVGYVDGALWSKVELSNVSQKQQHIFINPKVNINSIDVFVFENGVLKQTQQLGNYRSINQNYIASKFSNFLLETTSNNTYVIITKIKSKSPIDATWIVSDNKKFLSFILYDLFFWGIFFGVIIILVIYNISVFVSLKDSKYMAYVLHGLTALLFQFATSGVFYQFELYSNPTVFNSISWLTAQASLMSILLFALLFFNTKKTMPTIHKIIIGLFVMTIFMSLLFVYSLFNVEVINTIRLGTKATSLCIIVFVLYVAFMGYRHKIQGALFYILGHGIFLMSILYQQFGGIINQETSLLSLYIVPIGILFDVVFLSLALGEKLTALKHEKETNEKLLISQAGFSAIGRTIGNLSHQWKIPIARLGSLVTELEARMWQTQDKIKYEIESIVINMRSSLDFMQTSISELNNFYKHSSQKVDFNLASEIDGILSLLAAKIMYTNCTIHKNLDKSLQCEGHKNAFANVCLVIVDNALDILQQRQIQNGNIYIELNQSQQAIVLRISDDGGGIAMSPIEKIFDVFVSDKKDGNGMGLAMVKVLVKEKLDGSICAYNTPMGACFEITLSIP